MLNSGISINDINLRMNSISKQLNDSLPHFINSYAISEYKKLIENQMQDNNILAIICFKYIHSSYFKRMSNDYFFAYQILPFLISYIFYISIICKCLQINI